jgi:hypothetical protein
MKNPKIKLKRPWTWNPKTQKYELTPKDKPKPKRVNGRPRKAKLSASTEAKASPDDPRRHGDSLDVCQKHCAALKKYWLDRGYEVQANPEPMPGVEGRYRMITDLVRGAPKDFVSPKHPSNLINRTGSGASPIFSYKDLR